MAQAARKVTAKDANEKLAHRRLTVLELAERLGNVSEACRRGGIDRTSFYDWKRRFQLEGRTGSGRCRRSPRAVRWPPPRQPSSQSTGAALASGACHRRRPVIGPGRRSPVLRAAFPGCTWCFLLHRWHGYPLVPRHVLRAGD